METCRVEFITENNQKIIIRFEYDPDTDEMNYFPSFDPPVTDLKLDIGIAGQLCEKFLTAIDPTVSSFVENECND